MDKLLIKKITEIANKRIKKETVYGHIDEWQIELIVNIFAEIYEQITTDASK